jgi:hypothetical protein
MTDELSQDPAIQALAPTMLYDFEVIGHAAAIPEQAVRSIPHPDASAHR